MMPHILLAGKLHPAGLALLKSASGFTFSHIEEISEDSYAPLIGDADAIVIRTQPMTAATIAAGKKLKIVSRHGVGYDAVDVEALTRRDIPLTIVGDVNSNAVAEHTMMLILAASRRLNRSEHAVRKGHWAWRNAFEASEISGKHLLIIGYGRIGRHIARMALAFGMSVSAYDPYLAAQGWPEGVVQCERTLDVALSRSDIVTVHVPRTDHPILGVNELSQIKQGGIVINTARGGLIDEAALAAAIRDGHIGAAGFDVFDAEPPKHDHPLMGLDQVILTPHNAALTKECAERMAVASVQNVLDYFAGRLNPALVVNKVHSLSRAS